MVGIDNPRYNRWLAAEYGLILGTFSYIGLLAVNYGGIGEMLTKSPERVGFILMTNAILILVSGVARVTVGMR